MFQKIEVLIREKFYSGFIRLTVQFCTDLKHDLSSTKLVISPTEGFDICSILYKQLQKYNRRILTSKSSREL